MGEAVCPGCCRSQLVINKAPATTWSERLAGVVHNVPWQVGKDGILSPEGAEPWVEELAKGCAHNLALSVSRPSSSSLAWTLLS